jgi:hypothetical protein
MFTHSTLATYRGARLVSVLLANLIPRFKITIELIRKIDVFYDAIPFSLVDTYRRLRRAC